MWLENDLLPGEKVEAVPKVARVMMRTGWRETDPPEGVDASTRVRPDVPPREQKLRVRPEGAPREQKPTAAARQAAREEAAAKVAVVAKKVAAAAKRKDTAA